ncbi:MAG: hypothetical protein IT462_17275 [Planctomycetes bacterium]|nr:hypothetical protein [Planctomycetota bacterium]
MDDVIDYHKQFIDMRLIRENLALTPTQRIEKMVDFLNYLELFKQGKRPLERRYARLLRANQPNDELPKKLKNWRNYIRMYAPPA